MNELNDTAVLLARRAVLGEAYRLFYREPFYPVCGEDVWLFDENGRAFLDAYNNVPVVGHANAAVVEAVSRQMATLCTHTRYLGDAVLDYAERLLAYFPSELNRVMFTCTGSEANDLAIRIAEAVTGGTGMVVTANAYHGVTHILAKLSPSLALPADFVRTVAPPVCGVDGEGERFGREVAAAFADLQANGIKPCALLFDTVFASDGILPPEAGLFDAAAQAARAAGALVIADEVQAGFGRLGGDFWGFKTARLAPDMVTMGKPMGNGYPVGAVVAQADWVAAFAAKGRYFNTFGGNPVAAAAAAAVLDELEQRALPQAAEQTGKILQDGLQDALSSLGVTAIRGQGLYWGIEIAADGKRSGAERAVDAVNHMRHNGVLINNSGPNADVLKIRPPLTFGAEHAAQLTAALAAALND